MANEIKKYRVNGQVLTFEVEDFDHIILFAGCKENKRDAFIYPERNLMEWIDDNSQQLIPIEEIKDNNLPYGYNIWGGEVRDLLPHGARHYVK